MDDLLKASLWEQFGAAIDMLDHAIRDCPDPLWHESLWPKSDGRPDYTQFWYLAFHALFWLDLYLSGSVDGFTPPPLFTLAELDPAGLLPDKAYTQSELLGYLDHCRGKGQAIVEALNEQTLGRSCTFSWGSMPFLELLLYNMRHVQEHATQLNLLLGQKAAPPSRWITRVSRK